MVTVFWSFEIISFFWYEAPSALALLDILNGLQGVVIFILFMHFRFYREIIRKWFRTRGKENVISNNDTDLDKLSLTNVDNIINVT